MKIYIMDFFEMDKPPAGYLELMPIAHEKILEQLKDEVDHRINFGFTRSDILVASISPIETHPEVIVKKGGNDYFVIRCVGGGYVAKAQIEKHPLVTTTDKMEYACLFSLYEAILWCKRISFQNVKTEIIYSLST